MKKVLFCLAMFWAATASHAQFTRYVIQFKNKATSPYSLSSPLAFLSQRAIDRRTRYGIALDSTDLPVTPRYVDSVRLAGAVTILNVSRWLNSVSIQTSDATALTKINALPFVQSATPIAARLTLGSNKLEKALGEIGRTTGVNKTEKTEADYFSYGSSYEQVHIHNGEFLHNIGLRGQGMIIGMLDAGFYHYTTLRAFDSVNAGGQVLGTYDFVARETSVVEDDTHGMACFSIIAANIPGQFVGTAPKASFYLYRSEDAASEYPIEEHNWACAAERADSVGSDLISTSLGYTTFDNSVFDHTYAQMNGNITVAARAADLAAKKGILVAVAMGNDGAGSWKYLSTPADADSVMAVGSVTKTGTSSGFSSYGPSSDGQVKPDVASVGTATTIQSPGGGITSGNGTSFATPNMAGLATCLWQGFPEVANMRIITALRQASTKYTSPDDRVGYGIPDVKKAVMSLVKDFSTATGSAAACKTTLSWTSKDVSAMKYEIERQAPGQTSFTKIGERQGTGGSFAVRNYQYADTLINVQAGTLTYRIRQIIDTASATLTADYIDTVTINLGASCVTTAINPVLGVGEEIVLMPNPAREKITVKVTTPYPVSNLVIRISDAKGSIVSTLKKTKTAGTASFDVPSYQLARGKYFVSIYNGDKLMATKELLKL